MSTLDDIVCLGVGILSAPIGVVLARHVGEYENLSKTTTIGFEILGAGVAFGVATYLADSVREAIFYEKETIYNDGDPNDYHDHEGGYCKSITTVTDKRTGEIVRTEYGPWIGKMDNR